MFRPGRNNTIKLFSTIIDQVYIGKRPFDFSVETVVLGVITALHARIILVNAFYTQFTHVKHATFGIEHKLDKTSCIVHMSVPSSTKAKTLKE